MVAAPVHSPSFESKIPPSPKTFKKGNASKLGNPVFLFALPAIIGGG